MGSNNRKYKATSWMEARAEAWFHEDYDMAMLRSTSKGPTWSHMRRCYEEAFLDGQKNCDFDVEAIEKIWEEKKNEA